MNIVAYNFLGQNTVPESHKVSNKALECVRERNEVVKTLILYSCYFIAILQLFFLLCGYYTIINHNFKSKRNYSSNIEQFEMENKNGIRP